MNEFRQGQLNEIREIVLNGLKGHRANVYLFGSSARGDAWRWSDVDVAFEALEPLPGAMLSEIAEALEEGNIVYQVDLVDVATVDREFRQEVEREGIPWTR